jgi:hypothetical protein
LLHQYILLRDCTCHSSIVPPNIWYNDLVYILKISHLWQKCKISIRTPVPIPFLQYDCCLDICFYLNRFQPVLLHIQILPGYFLFFLQYLQVSPVLIAWTILIRAMLVHSQWVH